MTPSVQVFWVPKLGNAEEEYEDASSVAVATRRFAIADGATESSFADRWARSLVERFTAEPPLVPPSSVPLPDWLAPLQQRWYAEIAWDKLPWFAEEKARSGAFAALLGVYFLKPDPSKKAAPWWSFLWKRREQPAGVRWHAMAIGDSCLFQVREEKLLKAFPMDNSARFSDRPLLVSSNQSRNQSVWSSVELAEGDCRAQDLFLLCTDAVAKWFLAEHEAGRKPWEELTKISSREEFAALVSRLRENKSLKNDDSTILTIRWTDDPEPQSEPSPERGARPGAHPAPA